MPKDGHVHGWGGKQWKGDPPPKMPENKCPRCGNLVDIRIDHRMRRVQAHCLCFGTLFLPYKGPAYEAVDYADNLLDQLSSRGADNGDNSVKKVRRVQSPSDWTRKVVTDFLVLNPTAKDAQVAAKILVSISEVRSIRESIEIIEWRTKLPTIDKPEETRIEENSISDSLVECPYCVSKVRKDRLAKHLRKVHKKYC